MSSISRTLGLVRSLAIYHGIPFRQRRMRRLYRQFAAPGDLVFDIGAHAGNRVRAFAALGCRVVAVEPQPDFARLLRGLSRLWPRVDVIRAAVGERPGQAALAISDRTPTVSTMAGAWRAARAREPEFAGVRWNREIGVEVVTLDQLIARYGLPRFVKIDVEGAEAAVLAGLGQAVPALSFEYLPRAVDEARASIARLHELGRYQYNWSAGESYRLVRDAWIDEDALIADLRTPRAQRRAGDVYAMRLADPEDLIRK